MTVKDQDLQTIANLCLLAALSDGHLSADERGHIQDMMRKLGGEPASGGASTETDVRVLAGRLSSPEASRLAFEMAVAVCHADGVVTRGEEDFIRCLWPALGLDRQSAERIEREVGTLALVRFEAPTQSGSGSTGGAESPAEMEQRILRYAMLAGAAELLPQALATVAVLPIQMRLVNGLADSYGYAELDAEHFKELLATFGIGMTSQFVDGIARRLLGGVLGGLVGGAASAATSTALAFGTTYAIGHVAKTYYARGRAISQAELKTLYGKLLEDGKTLYPRMEMEVRGLADKLSFSDLMQSIRTGLGSAGLKV